MTALRRVDPNRPPSRLMRIMSRIGTTRSARFISRHVGWRLDPLLLRLSGGRLATTVVIPTAVLETRGARSGARRRNAVIYFHDGERAVIAASNAGAARHPDWFHNLLADPHVTLGGVRMRADVISDAGELARLWPLADRVFPAFADYRRDAGQTGRTVPLIALTPI